MSFPSTRSTPPRPLSLSLLCLAASLFSGCGGSGGAAVSTPPAGIPAVTLSASSLTFAATTVGASSATQTVTLTSTGTGTATVAITSVTLSDTTDYALTSTCSGGVFGPGTSCTLVVTFTPRSAATLPATISIADNVAGSPQTISLTGTGTAAPAPQAVLSPTSAAYTAVISSTSTGTTGVPTITLSNPGNATLTGIALSITGTGANVFSVNSTTCGTILAAGAGCNIILNFAPASVGSYSATLSVADSASRSPQTVALTGTATGVPAVTSSANSIPFPTTLVAATSAASSVTLSNSGTAPLTINGITLGGANPSDFATTNTCGATLAIGAACTISATFTPAAAQSYAATISIAHNATNSPQTISLSGTGTAATSTVTRTLYTFPESDNSVTPLYALVASAQKTIDMTMYELQDTTFDNDLIAACARGVRVRVILSSSEKSNNTPAYTALNTASTTSATAGANCSAVLSNTAFTNTHQKTITIDNATTAIMTLNLQSQYYSTTRDFALVENDTADIAAIEATFAADYAAGTPYNGTQGASDFSYTPALGDDLIWSPTTAQAAMESIIKNAKSTLLIENEELASSASYIVTDLVNACQRGVVVHFTIVDSSSYDAQLTTIKNAGCSVHIYQNTATGFYVHAKVVVADYGLSTQNVYMGSINYSNASMNMNRELGLFLSDNAAVQTLQTTLTGDYNGGTAY